MFQLVDPPQAIPDDELAALLANPGFGRIFTDHMVTMQFDRDKGWHDGRLTGRRHISLDPAAMVLHYAQEIFEGLKAFSQADGSVAMFRPYDNARRFRASADRMAMPELPDETFVEAITTIVQADRRWVPKGEGQSLYLRPYMIATEPAIGIRPADQYLFVVIAGPVDPIFSSVVKPVTVWLSHEYVRAAPGGTGEAKCGGNYAGSLVAQRDAMERGCDQVVWLDAVERRFVEEMGGMNLFFVFDDGEGAPPRVMTPALTGSLLPGVTRESLLTLAEDLGMVATEDRIDVDEWEKGCREGLITESFACGTAAVVTPIGEARHAGGTFKVGDGGMGSITAKLRQALIDIQYGRAPDPHHWMHPVG
jgi:branched-chain amino acid aminotransferase